MAQSRLYDKASTDVAEVSSKKNGANRHQRFDIERGVISAYVLHAGVIHCGKISN